MKGTIARKGNRYYPVIDIGKHPETRKRRRKWHPGHDLKKNAQAELNDILSRMQSNSYVVPKRTTLGEFLNEWLETRRNSIRPTTHANYSHQLTSYVIPHLGSRRLQDISPMELTAFYGELLNDGRRQASGGLSPKSVLNVHGVLRKSLNDAVAWNLLTTNPAEKAELPKSEKREKTTWSADQIRLFLDSEEDRREYALWHLAVSTGMRRGELLGLPWRGVDFENHRLSIVQTLVNLNNSPTLTSAPKTDSSRRSVELDPRTVQVLKDHRRRTSEERLIAGAVWHDNDLVFCRTDGSPEKPERITRVFGTRTDVAGLPRIRFHDLRHSWATLALGTGIPAKVVSERLGHSSVLVTMDTYSHVTPGMDRQAAEQVAALFE